MPGRARDQTSASPQGYRNAGIGTERAPAYRRSARLPIYRPRGYL